MWVVGWASSTSSSEASRIDPKRVRNPTNTFTTIQRRPIDCCFLLVTNKSRFGLCSCLPVLRVHQYLPRSTVCSPGERRGHQVSQILTCFETRNSAPAPSHHCFEDRQSSGFYAELRIFPTSIELTNMAPLASSALSPNVPS